MSFDQLTEREYKKIFGKVSERGEIEVLNNFIQDSSEVFEVEEFNIDLMIQLDEKTFRNGFSDNDDRFLFVTPKIRAELYDNTARVTKVSMDMSGSSRQIDRIANTDIVASQMIPEGCSIFVHTGALASNALARSTVVRPEGVYIVVNPDEFW